MDTVPYSHLTYILESYKLERLKPGAWGKVFELLEEQGYNLRSLKELCENFIIFSFCFEEQ